MCLSFDASQHAYYATRLQKCWRGYSTRKSKDIFLPIICRKVKNATNAQTTMFMKSMKIMKKFPPSKNEYKFIFGNLVQCAVNECLSSIFYKSYDLDKNHSYGSEYKNDTKIYLTKYVSFKISIKAKSTNKSSIILINKHTNQYDITKTQNKKRYNLNNLITCVVTLREPAIYFIDHNTVPCNYVKDSPSNISYKSSLITHYKNTNHPMYLPMVSTTQMKEFMMNILPTIEPYDIYDELFNQL